MASDLGYRPNALARAMISGRSRLIALVTPNVDTFFTAPAVQLLSRELQKRGYSNLLFISESDDELKKHNVSVAAREVGGFTAEGAEAAARLMFAGNEYPDAVFVASDQMAFAVMDVIRSEFGLSIPEQVSVIGFDDVAPASWRAYDLTTVAQDLDQMIATTVDTLIEQIESESLRPASRSIPVSLVVRGSTRLPQSQSKVSLLENTP